MDVQSLTPTQRRILTMLYDGHRHTIAQIKTCLNDDRANDRTVQQHISLLRTKLQESGEDIAMIRYGDGVTTYQLVTRVRQS